MKRFEIITKLVEVNTFSKYASFRRELKKQISKKPYKKDPNISISMENKKILLPIIDRANKTISVWIRKDDIDSMLKNISLIEAYLGAVNLRKRQFDHDTKEHKADVHSIEDEILFAEKELSNISTKSIFSKDTPKSVISKEQFMELSKVAHPDKGGSTEAQQIVNSLYDKKASIVEKKVNELMSRLSRLRIKLRETKNTFHLEREKRASAVIDERVKELTLELEGYENG